MNIKYLTAKLAEYAKSNKQGFTLNINTLEPITSGYVASYKATQNSFSETDLQSVIVHALAHDCVVGGWYNAKDGKYYFDSNRVFSGITDAIKFGIANEQLAIFDIANKKEIRLDETYYVQETVGGWRQNAVFRGTFEECQNYLDDNINNGSYAIVSEKDYKVDYL